MINKKAFLGISFAAVFAVAMIFTPNVMADDDDDANGSFLDIVAAEIEIEDGEIEVEIETAGDIPTDGTGGLFGYGIITSGFNNVLAVTTHLCAADSPVQGEAECSDGSIYLNTGSNSPSQNDETWHPHILDLEAPDTDTLGLVTNTNCQALGADAEVDILGSVLSGNNVSPTTYDLEVDDNEIEVTALLGTDKNGNENVIPDGTGIAIVSFEIGAGVDANGNIGDLCVLNVSDPFTDIEIEYDNDEDD